MPARRCRWSTQSASTSWAYCCWTASSQGCTIWRCEQVAWSWQCSWCCNQPRQPEAALPGAVACLCLLTSLVHVQPQLAAQVADAGAIGPLLRAINSSTIRTLDRDRPAEAGQSSLSIPEGSRTATMHQLRHAKEAIQAGATQLIARVVVQQRLPAAAAAGRFRGAAAGGHGILVAVHSSDSFGCFCCG